MPLTYSSKQAFEAPSEAVCSLQICRERLVTAAHPEDETIGAGVLISRAEHVQVVHATEGSPPNLSDALAADYRSKATRGEMDHWRCKPGGI
jgi:hypothetical protein